MALRWRTLGMRTLPRVSLVAGQDSSTNMTYIVLDGQGFSSSLACRKYDSTKKHQAKLLSSDILA